MIELKVRFNSENEEVGINFSENEEVDVDFSSESEEFNAKADGESFFPGQVIGGSLDHSVLDNRDLSDQHPIESISGLRETLNNLSERLTGLEISTIVTVATRGELPNRGNVAIAYIVADENATYRWDEENSKYFCVGRDYNEIEVIICGGNA